MGQLLFGRDHEQGISGDRQLHSGAAASVASAQARESRTEGGSLSTPATLRAIRARAASPAWSRRVEGEGVMPCPRAGCREIRMSGSMSRGWKRTVWRALQASRTTPRHLLTLLWILSLGERLRLGRLERTSHPALRGVLAVAERGHSFPPNRRAAPTVRPCSQMRPTPGLLEFPPARPAGIQTQPSGNDNIGFVTKHAGAPPFAAAPLDAESHQKIEAS